MPKDWEFCLFDELFANWFGEATYSNSMTLISHLSLPIEYNIPNSKP